jgi:5'-nucleotidase
MNIILNKEDFEKRLADIKKDGIEKFFVLSDFDGTLTKMFYRGKKKPSLISILRSENLLSPDYSKKAEELYEKYHPIEVDPKVPLEEKARMMERWWMEHYSLLIESGLERKHIRKVIASKALELRSGARNFFKTLKRLKIPLIILSSSGLGYDAISMFLRKEKLLFNNIFIISNRFVWQGNKVIGVKKPIIHSLNKNYAVIKHFPEVFEKVKGRKNALLLGNDINDAKMSEGLNGKIVKIGFLNEDVEENLGNYKELYDALILKDGSMDFVSRVLRKLWFINFKPQF